MSTQVIKGPYSFGEILKRLDAVGHTHLWLSSSNGYEGGNLWNDLSGTQNNESVWVMPVVLNRDGFVVAERRGDIHDWFLCGNWKSNELKAYSCPPAGVSLENQLRAINEKAALMDFVR